MQRINYTKPLYWLLFLPRTGLAILWGKGNRGAGPFYFLFLIQRELDPRLECCGGGQGVERDERFVRRRM